MKTIKQLSQLNDEELLSRLIYGEARNQKLLGMLAVANVVINRFKDRRFGKTLKGTMLRKWAFSCFNYNDPNLQKLLTGPFDKEIEQCRIISYLVLNGFTKDPTFGATHYYNPKVVDPFKSGSWKKQYMKYCCDIGNHKFYKEL